MRPRSLAAAGVAGAAWSLPALAPLQPSLCRSLRVTRTLPAGHGQVALTFDDGPHPQGTPAVLRALADAGAGATFFLVGEQVRRWPGLARDIVAAGHCVALHGDRHRNQLCLTPRDLARDLDHGHAEIERATGVAPAHYRPPYGVFSAGGLVVSRRRWAPVLWSRWGRDWTRRATPAGIAAKLTADLRDGDILLLHDADHYSAPDSWRRTADSLPLVLEGIARHGLRSIALPA